MHPRIILRTHYQADEPRTIIATVTMCSSPTESRREEAVAAALVRWAKENGHAISIPGAVYAVGNAISLGLLNNSHRWTARGLACGYIESVLPAESGSSGLVLRVPEERLYLKCYMERGGALLIKFGQWLLARGGTTDDELRAGSVIEMLLVQVLDEYLALATDVRDRTAIRRERDRLRRSDYAPSTKRHKRYPLVKTMERLRLVATKQHDGHRDSVSPDPAGQLASLLSLIPDVAVLERHCRENALDEVIDRAGYESERIESQSDSEVAALLMTGYNFAIGRGLQACPLAYLEELLFAYVRRDPQTSGKRVTAEGMFDALHRRSPNEVRFHVDRQGRRAFVLVTGDVSNALEALLSDSRVAS
jgi:hypothetical protein